MSPVHYLTIASSGLTFLIDCKDCKVGGSGSDTSQPDTFISDTIVDTDGVEVGPGEVAVSRPHWRLTFEDDFRGPTGKESDTYCFDTLEPQCHIWAPGNFACDLEHDPGASPIPPLKENLVAAIKTLQPNHNFAAMSLADVKALYSSLIKERLADLDKCTWTSYMMVNWMATDYAGRWSARFDATQVLVDAAGKGTLKLFATHAPVEANCIFGGSGGAPNCQIKGFAPGELVPGVSYWVDPDPRWAGVYYAPVGGACPHGGTFSGVNCIVYSFPPNVLEAKNVSYWADSDARWPGVYYANQAYACRDNIDYAPALGFRNLTCPILNGGLMSYPPQNSLFTDGNGVQHAGGVAQKFGRFEAKAKIPKGVGAFPATWLMPLEGGWPYDGGEIDVVEARDNADETYHTFHSGRCYNPSNAQEIDAISSADCAAKGGTTTHMSKGFTTRERAAGEFWKRHHLFAVEWTEEAAGGRLDYYLNDMKVGTIRVGTNANLTEGAPASLSPYSAENFPRSPFYWILNHSTYVPPDKQAGFVQQVFEIDYIKNYAQCGNLESEYCPDGGTFREGVGCDKGDGSAPYASPCQPAKRECVNGGVAEGPRCRVYDIAPGVLVGGVAYWADADPRWPGVFYNKINGGCPHGGIGSVNCQVLSLPADLLETGVTYSVDVGSSAIVYAPDFRN